MIFICGAEPDATFFFGIMLSMNVSTPTVTLKRQKELFLRKKTFQLFLIKNVRSDSGPQMKIIFGPLRFYLSLLMIFTWVAPTSQGVGRTLPKFSLSRNRGLCLLTTHFFKLEIGLT